jgi:hypothetical protein
MEGCKSLPAGDVFSRNWFGLFLATKKPQRMRQLGGIMEICVARQFSATMEADAMKGKAKEDWMYFCEQAAVEQDPDKLLQLVQKINQMLEEKENRLKRKDESEGSSETVS